MTLCALFAAVICVLSPISIQIGPIPVSLGLLGVLLAASVLGPVRGVTAVLVFILAGACGLPVFSGGRGGFSVLIGPTGGYIWGYLPAAVIAGIRSSRISIYFSRSMRTAGVQRRQGRLFRSYRSYRRLHLGISACRRHRWYQEQPYKSRIAEGKNHYEPALRNNLHYRNCNLLSLRYGSVLFCCRHRIYSGSCSLRNSIYSA